MGIAARREDLDVVAQPVEQGRGELLVAEDRAHSQKARWVVRIVERRS